MNGVMLCGVSQNARLSVSLGLQPLPLRQEPLQGQATHGGGDQGLVP